MVTVELEHLDLVSEVGHQHASTAPGAAVIPGMGIDTQTEGLPYRDAVDAFSRNLIQQVLEQTSGNRAAAARQLGLDSGNFHRMLKRLGV